MVILWESEDKSQDEPTDHDEPTAVLTRHTPTALSQSTTNQGGCTVSNYYDQYEERMYEAEQARREMVQSRAEPIVSSKLKFEPKPEFEIIALAM